MQLGFHNDSGAKNFVKATLLLYKAMKQQFPKVATMFTISKVDGKQNSQVKIQLKNSQAFYLLARKKHVLFAGHKETRDRFLKVWKGKAPSFGAKQPQLKKAFIEKDNRVLGC